MATDAAGPCLDASAIIAIHIQERSTDAVIGVIAGLTSRPLVTDFALGEVVSSVSRHVRMGFFSPEEADTVLADMTLWQDRAASTESIGPADMALAIRIVRRYELKLKLPDAIHVAVAARRNRTLLTLDRRMADAGRSLGITVILPDD